MLEAAREDAAYVLDHLDEAIYAPLQAYIEEAVKKAAYFD